MYSIDVHKKKIIRKHTEMQDKILGTFFPLDFPTFSIYSTKSTYFQKSTKEIAYAVGVLVP
jgi:hypothetical protein